MKRHSLMITVGAIALALFCFTAQAKKPGGGAGYSIVTFLPAGFAEAHIRDLNETGQAVGVASTDDDSQPVHFDIESSTYTVLSGGDYTSGVNNFNQVVGGSLNGNPGLGLFWSDPSAVPEVLSPLPGDVESFPQAINDAGYVVGFSIDASDVRRGVVWRVAVDGGNVTIDAAVELAPLQGGSDSHALDLTDVAGNTILVAGETWFGVFGEGEANLWTLSLDPSGSVAPPAPPTSLGTPGLVSFPVKMNDLGDVVGESDNWPAIAPLGQLMQALNAPNGTLGGRANDVNDALEIVGYLRIKRNKRDSGLTRHAYLWRNGEPTDLTSQIPRNSGWDRLDWPTAINNAGMIGGIGRFEGATHGFLLIPNEP